MPRVWEKKEMRANLKIVKFEIPMRLTPNSSGKGEAIINAPTTGIVQAK